MFIAAKSNFAYRDHHIFLWRGTNWVYDKKYISRNVAPHIFMSREEFIKHQGITAYNHTTLDNNLLTEHRRDVTFLTPIWDTIPEYKHLEKLLCMSTKWVYEWILVENNFGSHVLLRSRNLPEMLNWVPIGTEIIPNRLYHDYDNSARYVLNVKGEV